MPPPNDHSTFEELESRVEFEPEETFKGVFENWLALQQRSLEKLKLAAESYNELTPYNRESTQKLRDLVARIMGHYENYYRVKSESVKQNVLQMLSPGWRSDLEGAFLWIGGWRPSMAFHLLYSLAGLQLEARLSELLEGLKTGDVGDLSPSQLGRVNDLQKQTVKEERELTEKLAAQQETVADSPMVELSHLATELMKDHDLVDAETVNERVGKTLESKENKLEEIFKKADDLRLRTLKNVVRILSPIQAVHFLIAAAQLHLKLHEWGMKKDADAPH